MTKLNFDSKKFPNKFPLDLHPVDLVQYVQNRLLTYTVSLSSQLLSQLQGVPEWDCYNQYFTVVGLMCRPMVPAEDGRSTVCYVDLALPLCTS
jgi:hypothetical protein